jgi:hypothetical protein
MSDKPFQLDKKELLKDLPVMLRPLAGSFVDFINKADMNKDGMSDLAQVAPYFIKALPFVTALAPLIDWDQAVEDLVSKYVKNQELAKPLIEQLKKQIGNLMESKGANG